LEEIRAIDEVNRIQLQIDSDELQDDLHAQNLQARLILTTALNC